MRALNILLVVVVACGSTKKQPEKSALPECDEYLKEYQRCMSLVGGGAPVEQRVKGLSSAYAAAAASPDASVVEEQREQCRQGTTRLRAACQ